MTTITKTVDLGTAAYPSGYDFPSTDTISPTAIAATGLYSDVSGATAQSSATINGGSGGLVSGSVVAGGIGVDLTALNLLQNLKGGAISGGTGVSSGGTTGAGGNGASLAGSSTLNNAGTVSGGDGSANGGVGGVGVYLGSDSDLQNSGTIKGGSGGGTGLDLKSGTANSDGSISGGFGAAAGAGDGGTGVYVGAAGVFASYGKASTITGGNSNDLNGGSGIELGSGATFQDGGYMTVAGGNGAYGGAGIFLTGDDVALTLAFGTEVSAGNGLAGDLKPGSNDYPALYGLDAEGGVGVHVTAGSTLTVDGASITGGTGATTATSFGGLGGSGVKSLGGAVHNNGGTITGGTAGTGGAGYQNNGGTGVYLKEDSTLINANGTNPDGGAITGTITGGSTTYGSGGVGVFMNGGGQITNSGEILGGASHGGSPGGTGLRLSGTSEIAAKVTNSGVIAGGNGFGTLGGTGLVMGSNSYLDNTGVVAGSEGSSGGAGAVFQANQSTDIPTSINASGAFIQGGNGSDGSGGVGVDLTYAGDALINDGTIVGGDGSYGSDGAGAWVYSGAYLKNAGTIESSNGSDNIKTGGNTHLASAAGVYLDGGELVDSGSIDRGVNLYFSLSRSKFYYYYGASVQFAPGSGGTNTADLVLDPGWSLSGEVTGFAAGDKIDLGTLAYATFESDPGKYVSTATAGEYVFTVPNGEGGTTTLDLSTADFGRDLLNYAPDTSGTGTEITLVAPCYLKGTRIRTEHGELPIEMLQIGDRVLTRAGALRPIRWIGRRSYPAGVASGNRDLLPVRVCAGALGGGLPLRDLHVSPEHALLVAGQLVPARALLNGDLIRQDERDDEISYFHLEFDSHDVIYAEGALAESFVDDRSRLQFDNVAEYFRLHPHTAPLPASFCAPRVEGGWELEALRRGLEGAGFQAQFH